MGEQWKDIDGFEGLYQVSDAGRVRRVGGVVLRGAVKNHGYVEVALWRGSRATHVLVHRLVLLAFVGLPEANQEARHRDGSRLNNASNNLAWTGRATNMRDQYAHGTRIASHWHPLSAFSAEMVEWIRESPQSGAAIARALGVDVTTVCRARRGVTYSVMNRSELAAAAATGG